MIRACFAGVTGWTASPIVVAIALTGKADDEGATLHEAALVLGVSCGDLERIVDPATMGGRPRRDLGLADRPAG